MFSVFINFNLYICILTLCNLYAYTYIIHVAYSSLTVSRFLRPSLVAFLTGFSELRIKYGISCRSSVNHEILLLI